MLKLRNNNENYWASISDLMSGLMLIFLLLAIAYMHNVAEGQQQVKQIAVAYQEAQLALYERLLEEFENDLQSWKAVIDEETLAIQFFEPEVLFKTGSSEVTNEFKVILSDFFPRYLNIIFSDEFKDHIAEVRIEGHTSSEWSDASTPTDAAYFYNMHLSQERTLGVLSYCYSLIISEEQKLLMKEFVTANGLSSSKLILNSDGSENKSLSRRVEFRTRTNAENKIVQILEEL